MPGSAKLERELYPPVTAALQGRGLRVWEEATIRAGETGTRTADHVAWEWNGDRIEALAVEVKPGALDAGLAQAVAYAAGFERVYVGAEEPLSETGYMARVLDTLGIGYVHVTPSAATFEREALPSLFVVDAIRDENLGRIRLRHLFSERVVGEAVRLGNDRRGDNWAVTGDMSSWQICGGVLTGSSHLQISLLAESKWVALRSVTRVDGSTLAGWLEALRLPLTLKLQHRHHNGRRPSYSGWLKEWTIPEGAEALDGVLAFARTLDAPRQGPQIEIVVDLLPHDEPMTESAAVTRFAEAVERMRHIRDNLNGLL